MTALVDSLASGFGRSSPPGRKAILFGGSRSNRRRDTHVLPRIGFAPDVPLNTGVRSVGMIHLINAGSGLAVIVSGLCPRFGSHTRIVVPERFSPDVALLARRGPLSQSRRQYSKRE